MANNSITGIWSTQSDFTIATALIDNLTFTAALHLLGNDLRISPETVFADCQDANFVYMVPFYPIGPKQLYADGVLGGWSWYPHLVVITPAFPPAVPAPVFGWWLTNLAGTELLAAGNFDPVIVSDANDGIALQLVYNYSAGLFSVLAILCN
jgi:hypothetical protein